MRLLLVVISISLLLRLHAQESQVSLDCVDKPLASVLQELSRETGKQFRLSDLVQDEMPAVTIRFEGRLEVALQRILRPVSLVATDGGDGMVLLVPEDSDFGLAKIYGQAVRRIVAGGEKLKRCRLREGVMVMPGWDRQDHALLAWSIIDVLTLMEAKRIGCFGASRDRYVQLRDALYLATPLLKSSDPDVRAGAVLWLRNVGGLARSGYPGLARELSELIRRGVNDPSPLVRAAFVSPMYPHEKENLAPFTTSRNAVERFAAAELVHFLDESDQSRLITDANPVVRLRARYQTLRWCMEEEQYLNWLKTAKGERNPLVRIACALMFRSRGPEGSFAAAGILDGADPLYVFCRKLLETLDSVRKSGNGKAVEEAAGMVGEAFSSRDPAQQVFAVACVLLMDQNGSRQMDQGALWELEAEMGQIGGEGKCLIQTDSVRDLLQSENAWACAAATVLSSFSLRQDITRLPIFDKDGSALMKAHLSAAIDSSHATSRFSSLAAIHHQLRQEGNIRQEGSQDVRFDPLLNDLLNRMADRHDLYGWMLMGWNLKQWVTFDDAVFRLEKLVDQKREKKAMAWLRGMFIGYAALRDFKTQVGYRQRLALTKAVFGNELGTLEQEMAMFRRTGEPAISLYILQNISDNLLILLVDGTLRDDEFAGIFLDRVFLIAGKSSESREYAAELLLRFADQRAVQSLSTGLRQKFNHALMTTLAEGREALGARRLNLLFEAETRVKMNDREWLTPSYVDAARIQAMSQIKNPGTQKLVLKILLHVLANRKTTDKLRARALVAKSWLLEHGSNSIKIEYYTGANHLPDEARLGAMMKLASDMELTGEQLNSVFKVARKHKALHEPEFQSFLRKHATLDLLNAAPEVIHCLPELPQLRKKLAEEALEACKRDGSYRRELGYLLWYQKEKEPWVLDAYELIHAHLSEAIAKELPEPEIVAQITLLGSCRSDKVHAKLLEEIVLARDLSLKIRSEAARFLPRVAPETDFYERLVNDGTYWKLPTLLRDDLVRAAASSPQASQATEFLTQALIDRSWWGYASSFDDEWRASSLRLSLNRGLKSPVLVRILEELYAEEEFRNIAYGMLLNLGIDPEANDRVSREPFFPEMRCEYLIATIPVGSDISMIKTTERGLFVLTPKRCHRINLRSKRIEQTLGVRAIDVSDDGRRVISASALLNADTATVLTDLPPHLLSGGLRFLPGTHQVLLSSEESFQVGNVQGGTMRQLVSSRSGAVAGAISSDGRLLTIAGGDRKVYLVDMKSGHPLRKLEGDYEKPRFLKFSTDQRLLAAGVGNEILIWDVQTGGLKARFSGHCHTVTDASFTCDGRLISCSLDGTVRIWELKTLKQSEIIMRGMPGLQSIELIGEKVIVGGYGKKVHILRRPTARDLPLNK